MSKIVVLPDLHIKDKVPYKYAVENFMLWFSEQNFNNEDNIFIQLGDLFDSAFPSPKCYDMFFTWYNLLKFKLVNLKLLFNFIILIKFGSNRSVLSK